MPPRTRPAQFAPRKQKVWGHEFTTVQTLSTAGVEIAQDLLEGYKADMGITRVSGVTCMRIVGSLSIGNLASASTSNPFRVVWGITWVRQAIAIAAAGTGTIPDPIEIGMRETPWIQRGTLRMTGVAGALTLGSGKGDLEAFVRLDITQMRKQPTPDYELVLVVNNGGGATDDAFLDLDLATMIALP